MHRDRDVLSLHRDVRHVFHWRDASVEIGRGARSFEELTYLDLAREWGQSIEFGDKFASGHCVRVAENAVALARALGLSDQDQTVVRVGGYLHDLGNVRVPREIRHKPGALAVEELRVVQMLPIWGAEMLGKVQLPWNVKPLVRWHQERFDGSGYPDHLRGERIPLHAQIVGIANVYDALTTDRPWRTAMSPRKAIAELSRCRRWWSDEVVGAALSCFATDYTGSLRLA